MRVRGMIALLFLACLFLFAPSLSAELYYLPGAAEAEGANGARFSSTIFITNPGPVQASVIFDFIPFPNRPAPLSPVGRDIPPGHTIKISEALKTLFSFTADVGTITVDSQVPIIMFMTTSNVADPRGTYGLVLRAMRSDEALTGGAITAHGIWASQSADFSRGSRTNVGVVLIDRNSEVELRIYDNQSVLRGTTNVSSVEPISSQIPLSEIIGLIDLPVGRVEFITRQGRTLGYTAVVDNVTSDGIAIQPEHQMIRTTDVVIDGAARTSGLNGTHWGTDVRIFNPNPFAIEVNVTTQGFPTAGSLISRTLAPRVLLEISDIVGSGGFNLPEGSTGAIRLSANSPFLVAGRTTNSDPTGVIPGTFSAYQSPVTYPSAFTAAGQTATLTGLEQSSVFRTNLGFLSGPAGTTATLTLKNSTGGTLATHTLVLEAREWRQMGIAGWFDRTTVPALSRVDIRVDIGSLDAYASKIDNGTGDPVVIPSLLLPPPPPAM